MIFDALVSASIAEQGKSISEMAVAWTAPVAHLYELVRSCTGWEHVDEAKAQQRPVIFVTPHLGCYDIAGRYLESRIPVTALYRPPKQKWLEPVMQQGRVRGEGSTAAADAGRRSRAAEDAEIRRQHHHSSDQVPAPDQGGDGVWADFFGRPAYTMTLLPRLAQSARATVIVFFFAERLPRGRGYHVHIEPMHEPFFRRQTDRRTPDQCHGRTPDRDGRPRNICGDTIGTRHPAGAPLPPSAG